MLNMKKIFIYLILLLIMIGLVPLANADLTTDILAYYTMDGDADDSVASNDGTVTGPTLTTGKINQGYNFTSGGDVITISQITITKNGFSTCNWFNTTKNGKLIYFSAPLNHIFDISVGSNRLSGFFRDPAGSQSIKQTTTNVSDGDFHYVCVVMDGTNITYYLDGGFENTETYSYQADWNSTSLSQFGKYDVYSSSGFEGVIDEISIWQRALTPTEVVNLYNSDDGLQYPFVTDTCSCAGLNTNWEIDNSDACVINDACDLGTGKLSFTGTGTTTCNATIDTTDLGDPGSSGVLNIDSGCTINIDN